jgi:uncharacterized protein YdhG (YjbR/CyaY superfamily)
MVQRDAASPREYLEQVPQGQREMLDLIREQIFAVAPEAEEINEYGMLGYKGLANLAAQKNYVALYVKPAVLAEHKVNFPGVSCGKSCLRFRNMEQIDVAALAELLRAVASS